MSTRRPRAEVDREIVKTAGKWRASPMVGLFLTTPPEDIEADYNEVLDAAARILNRLNAAGKGKRAK